MGTNTKISSGASIERNSDSTLKAGTSIDIKILHGMLGHASEAFENVKIFYSPRLNMRTCQRTVVLKVLYLVNVYALT